jgi:hypothetical protein
LCCAYAEDKQLDDTSCAEEEPEQGETTLEKTGEVVGDRRKAVSPGGRRR